MPTPLTRRGARSVTADFDRLANLIQSELSVLDIPEKIANDFALRCDMLSDHIERVAVSNEKAEVPDEDPKSKDQNTRPNATSGDKMAAPEWAQPARNETGDSIEPGPANEGYDANAVADDRGGPYKQEPDEPYMSGEFAQKQYHELRNKQEAGQIPGVDKFAADESLLRRMLAEEGMDEKDEKDEKEGKEASNSHGYNLTE